MRTVHRGAARASGVLGPLLLLCACGGGSGDGTPPTSAPGDEAEMPGDVVETTPDTGLPDLEVPPPAETPPGGEGPGEMPPLPLPEDDPLACSTDAQNAWVYDNMLDYYLFYDQVPVVEPSTFDSPEALLDAVRFEERDPFSFIAPATESDLEVEAGREFGLGYNWGEDDEGQARITRAVVDSPFGRAGIERGDIVVEIEGRPALEALEDRAFIDGTVFGTPESPGESSWTFLDRDTGDRFTERFVATEYAIDTVREVGVITNPAYDGVIGYFLFTRFLETSEPELDAVFGRFREAGVTDLVLDMRYNRGGRISIAQQLASLVVDERQAGVALQRYVYNDKYTDENFELPIRGDIDGLGLRRLVVLVTGNTASASELIANGLSPLMDVSVVGSDYTAGKPYIQAGRDRCDQRLNAIEAEAVNIAGVSVFGGIRPDCFAEDDRTRNFGIDADTGEIEGMLLAGLDLVTEGACEPFVDERTAVRGPRLESPAGQGTRASGGATLEPR